MSSFFKKLSKAIAPTTEAYLKGVDMKSQWDNRLADAEYRKRMADLAGVKTDIELAEGGFMRGDDGQVVADPGFLDPNNPSYKRAERARYLKSTGDKAALPQLSAGQIAGLKDVFAGKRPPTEEEKGLMVQPGYGSFFPQGKNAQGVTFGQLRDIIAGNASPDTNIPSWLGGPLTERLGPGHEKPSPEQVAAYESYYGPGTATGLGLKAIQAGVEKAKLAPPPKAAPAAAGKGAIAAYEKIYGPGTAEGLTPKELADGIEKYKNKDAGGLKLTPAQKKVDEVFAKDYADYYAGGGRASVDKDISKIKELPGKLRKSGGTGPVIGILPKFARDIVFPETSSIQEDFEAVAQKSLKKILGGQFAQEEAREFFARAFNPRLDAETNAKRMEGVLEEIEGMASDKAAAAAYYEQNGTLSGFVPESNPSKRRAKNASGGNVSPSDRQALDWYQKESLLPGSARNKSFSAVEKKLRAKGLVP